MPIAVTPKPIDLGANTTFRREGAIQLNPATDLQKIRSRDHVVYDDGSLRISVFGLSMTVQDCKQQIADIRAQMAALTA